MVKFKIATFVVVAQLALVINFVAGIPIETQSNIAERDVDLERRIIPALIWYTGSFIAKKAAKHYVTNHPEFLSSPSKGWSGKLARGSVKALAGIHESNVVPPITTAATGEVQHT